MLGRRGFALESAAARVCREAGARVGTNILVRDLDLPQGRPDSRQLEVVADGLPLFHGAQLAIDTPLVSPVGRDGLPRSRCAREDGAALTIARRRKERTCPELTGRFGRAKLVVFGCEVGGGGSLRLRRSCGSSPRKARTEPVPQQTRARAAWLRRSRSLCWKRAEVEGAMAPLHPLPKWWENTGFLCGVA